MVSPHSPRLLAVVLVALLTTGGLGALGIASAQQVTEYDAMLDSDGTAWQGQRLYFDGSRVVRQATGEYPSRVSASQREFAVRPLHDDNTVGETVKTVTLNRSGATVVSTADLDGRYVLTYDGKAVAVDGGDGSLRMGVSSADLVACSWLVTDDLATVDGTFDQMTANQTLVLERDSESVVSGSVDLPEGTEVAVSIHGDGARPFLFQLQTTLGPDGQFAERIDLSEIRDGTPVSVVVTFEGNTLVSVTGVVGDTTETVTSSSTTTPPSTTPTPPTTATTPGFGPVTALGGLVGGIVVLTAVRQIR